MPQVAILHIDKAGAYELAFEEAEAFMAKGRVADCSCDLIQCVCAEARKHDASCRLRVAMTCAVPIACEHGYDVCPECDPCTCHENVDFP